MIKFIKFFFSKLFWINTILAILVLYLLFYFTMHNLDNFTNHGIKIKVPNLLGTHINDVEDSLTNMSLRYQIRDSVYSDFFSMGTVIQQDPKADKKNFKSYVKPNRTIYLTVVKKQESFKILPDLLSTVNSKTIGKTRLERLGFKVELKMREHKDKDKVLEINYREKPIKPGTKLPKGAELTLIFGSGKKNKPVELPNFLGLNIDSSRKIANNLGLELDIHYYDKFIDLQDSLSAIVFSQYPDIEINSKKVIAIGSVVILDVSQNGNTDTTNDLDSNRLNE